MARLSAGGTKILDNYDRFTGVPFNATKVTTWYDGTAMNDSKVDNAIYFKNTAALGGGYSKRDYEGPVMSEWFGVKGDGIVDSTLPFQKAIDFCSASQESLYISDGTYIVNVESASSSGVTLKSNTHIILSSETFIRQKVTSKLSSALFVIRNINNVSIQGGNIIGDRSFTVTGGAVCHGILVAENANNITIKDLRVSDFRGDGIVLAAWSLTDDASSNILIDNVDSFNNRRQGLSIISAKNVRVLNSTFRNTNGDSPQAGIDIEPNDGNFVRDVIIDNCYFNDNTGQGLVITGNNVTSRVENIVVTNCSCNNNKDNGVLVGGRPLIKNITLENIKITQDSLSTGASLNIGESTDVNISNINILKNGTGLYHVSVVNASNLILDNIYSRSNSSSLDSGIVLSLTCKNVSITGCDIISRGDSMIFLSQVGETRTNIVVANNTFLSTEGRALLLNNAIGLVVESNTITGSAYDGINLVNCSNAKITANTINNAGSIRVGIDRGILLSDVVDSIIKNNKVRTNLIGGNRIKCALELNVNSKRNIIKDNNFIDIYPIAPIINLSNYNNVIEDFSILKTGSTGQRPVLTNNTIPVGYLYYDETLKTLIICKGAYETSTIAVNTVATASGNITITLGGVAYNVPILNGDSRDVVSDKIAKLDYDGWTTSKSGFTITFTKDVAGVVVDTTASAGVTGVALGVIQAVKGIARFYEAATVVIVDATTAVYTKTTINTAYPLATKDTIIVQDGAGMTYIKKDNSPTGNWSVFPTIQLT